MSVTNLYPKNDPSNVDSKDGVMVALLPITTDWCKIECPHMTLVYAGTIQDLKPTDFNELAKDTAMLASLSRSVSVKVMGVEVFGDQEKVDVLKIQPSTELWAMRRALESWNASQFPFQPHATVGPIGSAMSLDFVPRMLSFDKIMVGWGNDQLVFNLKQ